MHQAIPIISVTAMAIGCAAYADGLTAFQLQQIMASAATGNNVSVARIGAPNGVAGLDAGQHLTNSLTGDVSLARLAGSAAGMSGLSALSMLLSDSPSVRLFAGATTTGKIGGAVVVATTVDNPAKSGTIRLPPTSGVATSKFITLSVSGTPNSYVGYTVSTAGGLSTITLPAGVTLPADVPVGTQVGVVQQDDLPAFQQAGYSMQTSNGGAGGNLYVPPGTYWLSGMAYTGDGVTIVSSAGVNMAPASGLFDTWMPAATGETLANFEIAAQLVKNAANAFLIVTTTPVAATGQQDAEIIIQTATNQHAGLVGEEIQQHIDQGITGTGPQMFGYHLLDFIYAGQKPYFAGNEYEVDDTSGYDQSTAEQPDSKYLIHLDSIGNTPETAGISFESATGAGFHYGMICNGAILNWCVASFSGGSGLANVDGGFRPDGSMLATSIVVTGSARLGASVVSSQPGSYTITPADCGTTIRSASPAAIAYAVPTGLPTGCRVEVFQAGTGTITFVGTAGETIEAYGGASRTSGQYASAQLLIDTPGTFQLSGQIQ